MPSTTPLERSARGSARRADGEDKERSGVPQPLAPLRGAGGVVGLAVGREAPKASGSGQSVVAGTGIELRMKRPPEGKKLGEQPAGSDAFCSAASWAPLQLCTRRTPSRDDESEWLQRVVGGAVEIET